MGQPKTFRIAVLPGDGIGHEVVAEGVKALRAVESRLTGVSFQLNEFSVGAGEYVRNGDPMPEKTFQSVKEHDAILLGAVGLPDVRLPGGLEIAIQLDLRERLELYAGLRPIRLYHPDHTPLKGYAAGEIDFLLVREQTEGLFISRGQKVAADAAEVRDSLLVSRKGSERLFRAAFRQALGRRKKVTLVDKANVLPSMAFFRKVFDEVAREFPGVEAERIYVDAASLYFVRNPRPYDVVVTENQFGDILSDLASGLVGGMGMAPSADIGDRYALFQPAHGTAPDIAGKGIANPIATIVSVAMMLEWLGQPETVRGAALIRRSVEKVLADPTNRTADLGGTTSTRELGDRVAAEIAQAKATVS